MSWPLETYENQERDEDDDELITDPNDEKDVETNNDSE